MAFFYAKFNSRHFALLRSDFGGELRKLEPKGLDPFFQKNDGFRSLGPASLNSLIQSGRRNAQNKNNISGSAQQTNPGDEELHRRVAAILPAPQQNQQEHRNQGQLPEHIEHEQVEGDEDAEQRPFHYQQ